MNFSPEKPYHPTLHKLLNSWTTQHPYKKNQEALDFILHIARRYKDDTLEKWTLEKGADREAEPKKWYKNFLKNYN